MGNHRWFDKGNRRGWGKQKGTRVRWKDVSMKNGNVRSWKMI